MGGVLSAAAFREMAVTVMLGSRINFASLEANLGWGKGLLVYPILLFSLPLSGRSSGMTEILLTGTLSLNPIKRGIHLLFFYILKE